MTCRIIRITECAECPGYYRNQQGLRYCIKAELAPCPPTGTPAWCPLENLEDQNMCEMKGRNGIKMSGDIDWLLTMAEKEDGNIVSVGGLVAAIEEREQMAAILLRTIAAEAERTGSWHVPPDLQERLKAWVAERDGGASSPQKEARDDV